MVAKYWAIVLPSREPLGLLFLGGYPVHTCSVLGMRRGLSSHSAISSSPDIGNGGLINGECCPRSRFRRYQVSMYLLVGGVSGMLSSGSVGVITQSGVVDPTDYPRSPQQTFGSICHNVFLVGK